MPVFGASSLQQISSTDSNLIFPLCFYLLADPDEVKYDITHMQ